MMKAKCKQCGEYFDSTRPGHIFCKPLCANRYRNPVKKYTCTCLSCGNKFETGRKSNYCSRKCRNKSRKLNRLHTRKCKDCRKEFTTYLYNKIFCSKSCYLNHKRKPKSVIVRKCRNCNEQFVANNFNQRYCEFCSKLPRPKHKVRSSCKIFIHTCKNCGKAFTTNKKRHNLFCGKLCNKKYDSKHLTDYYVKTSIIENTFRNTMVKIDRDEIPKFLIDEQREKLKMVREYREQLK